MRMAVSNGSMTAASPATQLPTTVPSASEKVAEVINGSPGSKDQPETHGAATGATPSAAPAATLTAGTRIFGLSAEATEAGEVASGTRGDVVENGRPPSTHDTIIAISIGVSVGSFLNAPKPRAACHVGIRRVSTCSLIPRAHGPTSSDVGGGIRA